MHQQTTIGLETVLLQRPLGLAFDIDGTLSPMALTPGEARLYPGVAALLEQARDCAGVHVAIMTGRGIDDGAAIVNVDGLTYSGIHGLEWSDGLPWVHPTQIEPEALAYKQAGISLLNLVDRHLPDLPGIVVQRKRVGGSIHYRLSPHPEETRRAIFALLEEPARQAGMKLAEGKSIVEILPPLAIDKGTALRRFAKRFALRGIVFAGDDRTDLDAMQEVALLQREGLAALSIVVRQANTPPGMLGNADIVVDGVPGMATLLRKMVRML